MTREWKPGEIALRTGMNGETTVSMVVKPKGIGYCERDHQSGAHWHHALGGWNVLGESEEYGTYRPLVVIDPENRKEVERLAAACRREFGWTSGPVEGDTDATQAALRSLLAPPKPEEPTGLGAVIEDADGVLWVRVTTQSSGDPWKHSQWREGAVQPRMPYADIAVVKVLNPGWSE